LSALGAALFLFAASWWLADQISRAGQQARHRASARAIYDSIGFSLHQAVSASGALQLERARELAAVMEARLGSLLVLKERTGKLFDDLAKALKEPEPEPEAPKKDTPPKVKVDMTSDEHRVAVWKALQAFNEVWRDEAHILNLLEGAQAELGRRGVKHDFFHAYGLVDQRTPWAGATVRNMWARPVKDGPIKDGPIKDGIVKDSVKDTGAAVMAAPVAAEPPPPGPDDLPPPAPRPKKGKLAKHKRNMLA